MTVKKVPFSWIDSQGGGPVLGLAANASELYKLIDSGGDVENSKYVQGLRESFPKDYVDFKIRHIRKTHSSPPPTPGTVLPAKLKANGRFEIEDGHHRISRLVYDGYGEVSLDVIQVSPVWQWLENTLASIYKKRMLYQKIDHPWFDGWEVDRSPERLSIMESHSGTAAPGKTMLDIGSCIGGIPRSFASRGWRAYGIDRDHRVLGIAEYLDIVFGTHVSYVLGDDPYKILNSGYEWDVITCLSVFHRAIAKNEHEWTAKLYRRCMDRSRLFFVDAGNPEDPLLLPSPVPLDAQGFGNWLRGIAKDTHDIEVIGKTEGRTMFKCIHKNPKR